MQERHVRATAGEGVATSAESSEGLESFVAIVEEGSIAAAARRLGVPRETLSRRLSKLENRLGVLLLHRSTRGLTATAEGKALYVHARRMVDATQEAIRAVRRVDDVPRGVLRVSLPPGSMDGFAGPMIEEFLAQCPEVELQVLATSRYVDLRAEGVDVALRGGDPQDDNLIARRLWRSEMLALAAPAYAERHGLPVRIEELEEHECLLGMMGGQPTRRWPTQDGGTAMVNGRLATNDLALQMVMVRRGFGIGMNLRPLVADELSSGALVPVLPKVLGSTAGMNVVFADKDQMQPKVRAFVDHVVRWFASRDLETLLHAPVP
ncbi:MAG: LysR family transcriptional regulator [Myxococcota bacterium]